jgi:hypothetical protein
MLQQEYFISPQNRLKPSYWICVRYAFKRLKVRVRLLRNLKRIKRNNQFKTIKKMKFKINLRQKPWAGSLFLLALLYASGLQVMYAHKIHVKSILEVNFQSPVTGTVSDDSGIPLPGASVIVKGTTNGTVTDFDGNYSIEVGTGGTLVFSYIGYKTIEVSVDGKSTINTTLPIDATQLDDVVVVGYGTQKKSEVTSSISQISGKDFQTSTASNAAMALQGRASGVEFVNSGTPGSTPSIRIR